MRERLCGCLFSGWNTERRYVEAIDRYRDVVLVDSVETVDTRVPELGHLAAGDMNQSVSS